MDYAVVRRKMVENQVRTNRVNDPRVIEVLNELPREAFLPQRLRGIAYVDEDIPLGAGRFVLEPLAMALILQAAEIGLNDLVLDIGSGLGVTAAAAARMAGAVVALESDPALATQARQVLADLGVTTVSVVEGPIEDGYPPQAPYDVILFEGAVAEVPDAILAQLAEGGRLVAVIAGPHGLGKGSVFLKTAGTISRRIAFDAFVPLLPGFAPKPVFQL